MSNSDLGESIRKLRVQHGYSQAQVADNCGVGSGAVSHWENGVTKPTPANRKKLEKLLGPLDAAIDWDGAFGRWLKQERERQGITLDELSRRSGISPSGISHIETGRIANPRSETMRKLADALEHGEMDSVGSELTKEIEGSNTIPGLGTFEEFSPNEKVEIPDCAGVYVLYDSADRPIYVGQSQNISRRIKQHQDRFWFKKPIVEKGAYIRVVDENLRRQLEKILIKFLKHNAIINKQNKAA